MKVGDLVWRLWYTPPIHGGEVLKEEDRPVGIIIHAFDNHNNKLENRMYSVKFQGEETTTYVRQGQIEPLPGLKGSIVNETI